MNALPMEIVGSIFTLAAFGDHRTALAISHTNRKWRRISTLTPDIWSKVTFDSSTNHSVDLLSTYLSGPRQLH